MIIRQGLALLASLCILVPIVPAHETWAQIENQSSWWIFSSGGPRSGGTYTLQGTLGQPNTGTFQGGSFSLFSGFFAGGPTREPVDLIAGKLEVTQAIQDLNNSVPLVAGKRTFIRFHVSSTDETHQTYARLRVQRGNEPPIWLAPVPGREEINVRKTPDRGYINDAFLFELPSGYRQGTISLLAEVNPLTPWRLRSPAEINYANNVASTNVSFTSMPDLHVRIVDIIWTDAQGIAHRPTQIDRAAIVQDIQAQFPVVKVHPIRGGALNWNQIGPPNLSWVLDQLNDQAGESSLLHFGLLVDWDGKAGLGLGERPGNVSTGFYRPSDPTTPAHELGHNLGRKHTRCSGGEHQIDANYPHKNGKTSSHDSGNKALFGYHSVAGRLFRPVTGDLMGYCRPRWVSDWTYRAIMNAIQNRAVQQVSASSLLKLGDKAILLSGMVLPEKSFGQFKSLLAIETSAEISRPSPGAYSIRFEDSDGQILATYPFEPTGLSEGEEQVFSFLLPKAEGAKRVLLLQDDQVLDTRSASAYPPTVNITSHQNGTTLDSSNAILQWTANDTDGDELASSVRYSTDGGTTWQTLISSWPESSYLDLQTLAKTDNGILRVLVSDGFHTTSTQVRVSFPAADRFANVEIVEPTPSVTIAVSQTLALAGMGYDLNHAPFVESQLLWTSDKDGLLGTGSQLSIADLSAGTHTITLHVEGGSNGKTIDTVEVAVVENPSLLPLRPDQLIVDRDEIALDVPDGIVSETIVVDNLNSVNALEWSVTSSEPWLVLDKASGTTPMRMVVSLNQSLLPSGTQTATLRFSNSMATEQMVEIPVRVENGNVVDMQRIYLPIIMQ